MRTLRKRKRVRQKQLATMVGISPSALANFEKGRRRISLDSLQMIALALDTPIAYFLGDGRSQSTITPGEPRERRLLDAWRLLGKHSTLREDFLRLMEHLGRSTTTRSTRVSRSGKRKVSTKTS